MGKTERLFEHTQRFVREVMADRLRQEGFSSYKGQDIHWYRLVDDVVVQTVYFVTRHTSLPAFMDVCYGCHPLFIPAVFQKSPYMHAMPGYEQMSDVIPEFITGRTHISERGTQLYGMINRPYREPDILIMCPHDKHYGIDTLEEILLTMSQVRTPEACYALHKQRRMSEIENDSFWTMSTYFVDEVLYWKDTSLYAYCQSYISTWLKMFETADRSGVPLRKEDRETRERLVKLNYVFEGGSIDDYIRSLDDREQKMRKMLRLAEKYT